MGEKWVGGPAVECWGSLYIFSSQSNGKKKKKKNCKGHGPSKPLCGSAPGLCHTESISQDSDYPEKYGYQAIKPDLYQLGMNGFGKS